MRGGRGGSLEASEKLLFGGFLPWILAIGAVALGWRFRESSPTARLSLVTGVTAALIVLATVCWPGGFSLWLMLCDIVEPLRGFRAIGRIHIVVHSLLILTIALGLHIRPLRSWKPQVAVLLVVLLMIESWAAYQPSYKIADAQNRRSALVDAWSAAGDHPVLAFAPGYTNQPDPHLQLDAWAAAIATQRFTLNGYSGAAPLEHLQFIWNPHRQQAESLAHHLGISPDDLSIVEEYPPEVAQNLGISYQSQRSLRRLHGFDLQPADWKLFSPIEEFIFDGARFYQFTPPASVRFRLPDSASQVSFVTGMRPGAYFENNDSDGYDISVSVLDSSGSVLGKSSEVINPRDDPTVRGFLHRTVNLPAGQNRYLEFAFGPGPSGMSPWDWPLLSQLRIE